MNPGVSPLESRGFTSGIPGFHPGLDSCGLSGRRRGWPGSGFLGLHPGAGVAVGIPGIHLWNPGVSPRAGLLRPFGPT